MLLPNWLRATTKYPATDFGYDVEAWQRANPGKDYHHELRLGHLPDTFKTPDHPSFSDQSIYHKDKTPGEHWVDDTTFIPSRLTIARYGLDYLKEYMQWADPHVRLVDPDDYEAKQQYKYNQLWK